MTVQSVHQTIRIHATPDAVWSALLTPGSWMGGAEVESSWQPGAAITFNGDLHGHPYRDRGTVLACEAARLLRYSHWSMLSRVPDTDATRSQITFVLMADGDGTVLNVTHDNLRGQAAFGHARFFWRYAVHDIKTIAERAHG